MPAKYVQLTDPLYEYLLAQRSNASDPVLEALWTETQNLGEIGRMAISPDQASLMTLLVTLIGAKWAVEVGTFTGTSSISIARGLAPECGRPLEPREPQGILPTREQQFGLPAEPALSDA